MHIRGIYLVRSGGRVGRASVDPVTCPVPCPVRSPHRVLSPVCMRPGTVPTHAFCLTRVALAMADQHDPDAVGPSSPLFGFCSSDVVSAIPHSASEHYCKPMSKMAWLEPQISKLLKSPISPLRRTHCRRRDAQKHTKTTCLIAPL